MNVEKEDPDTSSTGRSSDLETKAETSSHRKSRVLRRIGFGALYLIKLVVPVAILGGAFMAFQYMQFTKPTVQRRAVTERVYFIDTVVAAKSTVAPQLKLYGIIVAGREVQLRPLVSGRVVRVGKTFAEGGIVEKGDLLVEIDRFDYEVDVTERKTQLKEARARLKEIRADLGGEKALIKQDRDQIELRKRDTVRRKVLLKKGAGTEKLLDDSKIALNSQEQRLNERIRRVTTLEARLIQQTSAIDRVELALARAQRNLRDTKLVAPFDGFLREISTEIGKRVSINDPIARLTDARRFEAEFQVSDAQYGRLVSDGTVIGKPAAVVWKTSGRNFLFPAEIARVSGRVSSVSGGVNLFARLASTTIKTPLRPGVFVEVQITDRPFEKVFRLPDDALHDGRYIYVVVDERLERRAVQIAGRVGNDILVRGKIVDGDKVVARTFPEIGPGLKVNVPASSARNTQ